MKKARFFIQNIDIKLNFVYYCWFSVLKKGKNKLIYLLNLIFLPYILKNLKFLPPPLPPLNLCYLSSCALVMAGVELDIFTMVWFYMCNLKKIPINQKEKNTPKNCPRPMSGYFSARSYHSGHFRSQTTKKGCNLVT